MTERGIDPAAAQLPSGRHGLSREYVVRSQRTRLLAAAVHVAGTEGYGAMTVTALINRAGVSRKTFYELFDDREDCFVAALDLLGEQATASVTAAYASGATWPEQLRAAYTWMLERLANHPREARFGMLEVFAAGPRALQRRDAALQRFKQFIVPGYDAAPDGSALPPLLPEAIVGAIYEVVYARVLNGRAAELPTLVPDLMYCTLAPFVGPAAAIAAAGLAHGSR